MVRRPQGRHRLSCREFPEALWLTWVLTSGETEVRGMWVFSPGETPGVRKVQGSYRTGKTGKTGKMKSVREMSGKCQGTFLFPKCQGNVRELF